MLLLGGLAGVWVTASRVVDGVIEGLLGILGGVRRNTRGMRRKLLQTVASVHATCGHCDLACGLVKGHHGFFLVRFAHECKVKVSWDFVKV